MELTTEKIGDVTVVVLPGEQLDASNAKEFKRDIAALLSRAARWSSIWPRCALWTARGWAPSCHR